LKPGVSQVNVELPTALLDEVKAFAEGRGQHLREVVQRALRRHMDSPPPLPPPDPPLPPCEPDVPARKPAAKPRRRKGGGT
jgi:hypothetical protein